MKKKPLKAHFFILLLGSIIFLMHFFGSFETSGRGDRTLLEVWRIKDLLLSIAWYIVFAILVIGHGISDIGRESITDEKSNMEVLDGEVEKDE